MDQPLIVATLMLAGVSVAGLAVDARAATSTATRTFGVSALFIKIVLALAFTAQIFHVRAMPLDAFDRFSEHVTLFSLVVVAVPMVAIALACELAAWPRLGSRGRRPRTHVVENHPAED